MKYLNLLLLWFTSSIVLFAATDRYRIMWRDDPSTTMVIGWDQQSGTNPVVYYGEENCEDEWVSYPNQKKVDASNHEHGMFSNFARLSDLKPDTYYYFVIKDSEGISATMSFKTISDCLDERLSIISGGDSRNNRDVRQKANKLVAKLRPDFVAFAGDFTMWGNNKQWKQWLDDWQLTIREKGYLIPIVTARGNHDENEQLINLFDVPHPEVYYALSFADNLLRMYTLNTEIVVVGAQAEWLAKDLKAHQANYWRIAQYHRPIRPHVAKKSEQELQRRFWANLFYEEKVQLVVECDAHTVKTTWPIRPTKEKEKGDEGFIRDDENGTVYVGEGCWGAPLRNADDPKSWTRSSAMFNQFKWMFVDTNQIEIRTIKFENEAEIDFLTEKTRFTIPPKLDVWTPEAGAVLSIQQKQGQAKKDDPNSIGIPSSR